MFLRRPTFLLRLAVCLLAALQGVAVSWHVCDLAGPQHGSMRQGGAQCHSAVQRTAPPQCHADDPTRAWRMVVEKTPADTGASHCLAALLSTTPAQTAQSFAFFSPLLAQALLRTAPQSHLCDAIAFGIDARGPPFFS